MEPLPRLPSEAAGSGPDDDAPSERVDADEDEARLPEGTHILEEAVQDSCASCGAGQAFLEGREQGSERQSEEDGGDVDVAPVPRLLGDGTVEGTVEQQWEMPQDLLDSWEPAWLPFCFPWE